MDEQPAGPSADDPAPEAAFPAWVRAAFALERDADALVKSARGIGAGEGQRVPRAIWGAALRVLTKAVAVSAIYRSGRPDLQVLIAPDADFAAFEEGFVTLADQVHDLVIAAAESRTD